MAYLPSVAGGTAQLPQKRLLLLFLVTMVSAAGNTAMQSVMPTIGANLKIDDVWITLAFCWSATLWMICAPLWARRSDRRGRKAMMAIGLAGFVVSFSLCGLVLWMGLSGWIGGMTTIVLFGIARGLFGGFASAAPPAVQAYVASRTAPDERTQALALVTSSFGLGTVIGPALAPLMVVPGLGLTGPFAAFSLCGLAILIALRIGLPNDDPAFAARARSTASPFGEGAVPEASIIDEPDEPPPRVTWFDRRLRPWIIIGMTGGQGQAALMGMAGFMVLDRLGLRGHPEAGASAIALVLMSGALATLLAQWGLIPLLRLGPRTSCLVGMVMAILGTAIFALAGTQHGIALGYAVVSLGFGLFRPGVAAGTSLAVSRHEQGEAAGITASISGAAFIVAPAFGVWLYNHSAPALFGLVELACVAVFLICLLRIAPDD